MLMGRFQSLNFIILRLRINIWCNNTNIRKILHFLGGNMHRPPNIGSFVWAKWFLKCLCPPFPTCPFIEVTLYGNELKRSKIPLLINVPIYRVPTNRSCTELKIPSTYWVIFPQSSGIHLPLPRSSFLNTVLISL